MYGRKVDGRVLTFGVSGMLWKNSLVMYDRETETLWSHFTGTGLRGKHKGTELEMVGAVAGIPWREWKAQYPHTKVLSVEGKEEWDEDSYAKYHSSDKTGIHPVGHKDATLPLKSKVVGIWTKSVAKAYPMKGFKETPLIEDTFDGLPILVYRNPKSGFTTAWVRRLGQGSITFDPATLSENRIRDRETGTTWDLITGKAVKGRNTGSTLPPMRLMNAVYWFAWRDIHPDTLVYGK